MKPARQSAFTLVEVLVSLAIFAVLALISYRTLDSLFTTRERLQQSSTLLRDQSLFFTRLESDFNAILPRAIINADNLPEPALQIVAPLNERDALIRFSRAGFVSHSGSSAAPQRMGYRLRDGNIELLIWSGIDLAPRAEPVAHTALSGVREFRIRVLETPRDQPAVWRNEWKSIRTEDLTRLPRAIEVTLTPTAGSSLVRVFTLREVGGG